MLYLIFSTKANIEKNCDMAKENSQFIFKVTICDLKKSLHTHPLHPLIDSCQNLVWNPRPHLDEHKKRITSAQTSISAPPQSRDHLSGLLLIVGYNNGFFEFHKLIEAHQGLHLALPRIGI